MELLAPAGNLETAVAAFEYGADAVYFGMKHFSARGDAENFTQDDLAVLAGLAHGDARHPRKLYAAVNTLLREAELPQLAPLLEALADCAVDGVIVQDPALRWFLRRHFPELPMHASTQMAIHSPEGMRECRDLGYRRVIAARELTLTELGELAAVPDIELEVFVHGALCYAYSGLCLLSSVLNGHSGNRGECSYVCRNCWKIALPNGRTAAPPCNLMSMKDLALPDQIGALKRLGVASLKIEGRKKSPLYVAAVTNYYRHLIDNDFQPGEREACEQDIRTIFSRPWTRFFLPGPKNPDVTDTATTGHRGTPVGTVTAIVPGTPDKLRFQLQNLVLEKHDGLQVELDGRDRPFGFPVEEILAFRQGGQDRPQRLFQARPSTHIEVPLPDGHPPITPGQPVFCTSSQQVKQRYRWPSVRPALARARHPVVFTLETSPERLRLTAETSGAPAVTVQLECTPPLSPARKPPEALEEDARRALAKLGDTPFELAEFRHSAPLSLFIPASTLNELRRQAADALAQAMQGNGEARAQRIGGELANPVTDATAPERPCWIVKIDRPHALNLFTQDDLANVAEVILDLGRTAPADLPEPLSELARKVGRDRIRLALPAILRRHDGRDWPAPDLRQLVQDGWTRWQLANPAHLAHLADAGLAPDSADFTADWPLYATNTAAARELLGLGFRRLTLAPDDELDNTLALLPRLAAIAEVPVFQDTPLAISAVCANASLHGACPGRGNCDFRQFTLTARNGDELLAVNNRCQTVYLRRTPLDRTAALPRLLRAGARFLRADFLWRDWPPAAIHRQWTALRGQA